MEDPVKLRCLELAHKEFFSSEGVTLSDAELQAMMNRAQLYWGFCYNDRAFRAVMKSQFGSKPTLPRGIKDYIQPRTK
jgi:hypothetical protein